VVVVCPPFGTDSYKASDPLNGVDIR
jgi:hypothetical protein